MKFWQWKPISPTINATCLSALSQVENVRHLKVLARQLKARAWPERDFLSPKVPYETFYSPAFYMDQAMTNEQYEVVSWSPIESNKLQSLTWSSLPETSKCSQTLRAVLLFSPSSQARWTGKEEKLEAFFSWFSQGIGGNTLYVKKCRFSHTASESLVKRSGYLLYLSGPRSPWFSKKVSESHGL